MAAYWDAKARENAMYFIHSDLDYTRIDEASFWASGPDNLDRTLEPFGRTIRSSDDVVEIGCGIGRITRALAMRARHVIGVDVSAEMIARGRHALGDFDNADMVVGNGRDLGGLEDSSADVVYSFIVFQHIPDPSISCSYIREMGRVLRPGGWTVFQVSDQPEVHLPETWKSAQRLRNLTRRVTGRLPRGCLAPQWLGSSVDRSDLLQALADGGLVLDGSVGDGTQFCLVHARKPSA